MQIEDRLIKILPYVEKPARYIGGEWNQVKKDLGKVRVKIALAFPDAYEIGMSHTGIRILYDLLNKRPDIAASVCLRPGGTWKRNCAPNRSHCIRSKASCRFASLTSSVFSLMYELCYTNTLACLSCRHSSSNRGPDARRSTHCRGRHVYGKPRTISDFIDAFVIGDGEEIISEIVEKYMSLKGSGLSRERILWKWLQIPGCLRAIAL